MAYHPCAMDVLAVFATIAGLSAWTGSLIFHSFVVVPVVGKNLGPGKAAELLDGLHPRFFVISILSGVVMLIGAGGALFTEALRIPTWTFMGLTGVAVMMNLYAWLVLHPRQVTLRTRVQSSAGSQENFVVAERFDQACRLLSFVNVIVLLLLLGAAAALATLLIDPASADAVGNGN